jgi:hypothetical protein
MFFVAGLDLDAECGTQHATFAVQFLYSLGYWIMDQIFLMLGFWEPKNCFKLSFRQVLRGREPWAFLVVFFRACDET